jgi:serine protease Do
MKKLVVLLGVIIFGCAGINFNNPWETAEFVQDLRGSEVTLVTERYGVRRAFCAGVIISLHDILTAAHCAPPDRKIWVKYRNLKVLETFVIKRHPRTDLALLRIILPEKFYGFRPSDIRYVRDSEPYIGEEVWTVGSPTGEEKVVTTSRLSKHNVPSHMGFRANLFSGAAYYGNSGGPLFDSYGRIVGVLSQVGITMNPYGPWFFAVKVSDIKDIMR